MSFYAKYPITGGGAGGIPTYPNAAALPTSPTPADGAAAITTDTDTIYVYNAASNTWKPVASPGAMLSIGTIDSQTPSANGAVDANNQLVLQSASASVPGLVNLTTQTLAGNKTLSGTTTALTTNQSSINNSGGVLTIDIANTKLRDPSLNIMSIDWTARRTYDTNQNVSEDWNSRILWDLSANESVAWGGRSLSDPSGNMVLQWATTNRVTLPTLTASTALVLDGSQNIISSSTTATEIGYVSGVTSSIQTQLNGKQPVGSYITALTGDGTASGPGSAALTLSTVNTNVGSFTNASFTVNAKGLITAASSGTAPITAVSVATANGLAGTSSGGATPALTLSTTVTGLLKGNGTAISAAVSGTDYQPAGNYITALTGDVAASGPGSAATTLATVNGAPGTYSYASVTVNGKGLVTAASSGTAPVTTLAAVGASPNANAATISGNTLNLQPFSSTQPGVVTASGGGTVKFLRADGTWATPSSGGTYTAPTVQRFLSGTGTYTPPSSPAPLYIKVRLVGGGGGGGGSGLASTGASNGTAGSATTFGTSLLTANGGAGGTDMQQIAIGGTATVSSPAIKLVAMAGSDGGGSQFTAAQTYMSGGQGGTSPFGGAGASTQNDPGTTGATDGKANSGSGGGGAGGAGGIPNSYAGGGGASGGYIEAILASPTTYSYSIGSGGTAGAGGNNGFGAGAGGSGVVIVEEFYQ